jgi:hypothetical protein
MEKHILQYVLIMLERADNPAAIPYQSLQARHTATFLTWSNTERFKHSHAPRQDPVSISNISDRFHPWTKSVTEQKRDLGSNCYLMARVELLILAFCNC